MTLRRDRMRDRVLHNPFGSMAAAAAIVLGSVGMVIGDKVSQGMTNSLRESAPLLGHMWGVMFAVGGGLKLLGLFLGRSTMEIPGLYLMGGGYAFYSITVLTGLRTGGLAAGIISAALALGCLLKAGVIMRHARILSGGREGKRD